MYDTQLIKFIMQCLQMLLAKYYTYMVIGMFQNVLAIQFLISVKCVSSWYRIGQLVKGPECIGRYASLKQNLEIVIKV